MVVARRTCWELTKEENKNPPKNHAIIPLFTYIHTYDYSSYISPNVILFCCTNGLWFEGDGRVFILAQVLFFSMPLGVSAFLSWLIFIMTRLPRSRSLVKSLVDFAKFLERPLLSEILTEPFVCVFIWGLPSKFS